VFGSIRGNLFAFMIGGLVVVAVVDIVIDGPLMSSMKMLFERISCGKNARCGTDELITVSVYPTSEVAHDGRVSP